MKIQKKIICELRSEAFVKIPKKKIVVGWGGGGGGSRRM